MGKTELPQTTLPAALISSPTRSPGTIHNKPLPESTANKVYSGKFVVRRFFENLVQLAEIDQLHGIWKLPSLSSGAAFEDFDLRHYAADAHAAQRCCDVHAMLLRQIFRSVVGRWETSFP